MTPSYATSAARDHDGLLSRFVQHCQAFGVNEVETMFAVVDKLPAPSSVGFTSGKECQQYHSRYPPIGDTGREGLAFACTTTPAFPLQHSAPSASSSKWQMSSPLASANNTATISFFMNNEPQGVLDSVDKVSKHEDLPKFWSTTAQVPLPNTVFHNALPHTLLHSAWALNRQTDKVEKLWTQNVSHKDVTLPVRARNNGVSPSQSLSLPLVALTSARPVAKCMGNIVRKLSLDTPYVEGTSETMPASQELETAVSSYFKARSIAAQSVSVWALVLPYPAMMDELYRNKYVDIPLESHEQNWAQDLPRWMGNEIPSNLMYPLRRGAKLRKVMSGGGGWGKKAGLLSLDPHTSYDKVPEDLMMSELPLDMELPSSSPLEQIAQEGDLIQFFIWPYDVDIEPAKTDADEASQAPLRTVDFGTIPSSIDNMGVPDKSRNSSDGEKNMKIYENHFGVLSESGLSLISRDFAYQRSKVSLDVHQSKADVPFSRLKITEYRLKSKTAAAKNGKINQDPADANAFHDKAENADIKRQESTAPLNIQPTKPLRSDGRAGNSRSSDLASHSIKPRVIRRPSRSPDSPAPSSQSPSQRTQSVKDVQKEANDVTTASRGAKGDNANPRKPRSRGKQQHTQGGMTVLGKPDDKSRMSDNSDGGAAIERHRSGSSPLSTQSIPIAAMKPSESTQPSTKPPKRPLDQDDQKLLQELLTKYEAVPDHAVREWPPKRIKRVKSGLKAQIRNLQRRWRETPHLAHEPEPLRAGQVLNTVKRSRLNIKKFIVHNEALEIQEQARKSRPARGSLSVNIKSEPPMELSSVRRPVSEKIKPNVHTPQETPRKDAATQDDGENKTMSQILQPRLVYGSDKPEGLPSPRIRTIGVDRPMRISKHSVDHNLEYTLIDKTREVREKSIERAMSRRQVREMRFHEAQARMRESMMVQKAEGEKTPQEGAFKKLKDSVIALIKQR